MDADGNVLIDRLPADARAALLAQARPFQVGAGATLREPGDRVALAHFPNEGVLAALTGMEDGRSIETGLIGREGMTPASWQLGPRAGRRRLVALSVVKGWVVDLAWLTRLIEAQADVRRVFETYSALVSLETEEGLACTALHGAEQRLARLLLRIHDRAGTDRLFLTQEALGSLLGLQRTTICETASVLQTRKAIRYMRGRIEILDRAKLEAASCGCYTARDWLGQSDLAEAV